MKVNSIYGYMVSFNANTNNNSKQIAPRSQQQTSINFEKEQTIAKKADSLNANPLTSLGYKLYRTFRIISEHESSAANNQGLNVLA